MTGHVIDGDTLLKLLGFIESNGLALPPGLSYEEWASMGVVLVGLDHSIQWALGEWWLYGERHYGESAAQALPTGFSLKTLQNAAWVAERIEPSRRRESLSYAHHADVAALPPAQQDAILDAAEQEGLNHQQVRTRARRYKALSEAGVDPLKPRQPVELPQGYQVFTGEFSEHHWPGTIDAVVTVLPSRSRGLEALASWSSKVLRPGGVLVAVANQRYLPETIEDLGSADLEYRWTFAYLLPVVERQMGWQPAVLYSKGPLEIEFIDDVISPEGGLEALLRRLTLPGWVILDPMCGEGSVAQAARSTGRQFIGIEHDPDKAETVRAWLGGGGDRAAPGPGGP